MADRDPVTGAPRLSRSVSASRTWPAYPAGGYPTQPFYPPYGYAYAGYNPAPFLVPSPGSHALHLPASPNLVPASWANAYNEYYGSPTPLVPHLALHPERSPRRKSVRLPSPRNSPFGNLIALPALDDEDEEYEDTEMTWGARLRNWINGESSDAHSQFVQEILVHESLDRRRGIKWNISYPPHTIRINNPPDANDSAFEPPLPACRIVCSLLPWAIEVKSHSQHPYITVMSLLGDLYKALNKPIDRRTYESLPTKFREQLNESFHQRIYSIPDEEAAQNAYSRGIKRVDFLLDKRTYAGVVQIKNLMYTFELKLTNARA